MIKHLQLVCSCKKWLQLFVGHHPVANWTLLSSQTLTPSVGSAEFWDWWLGRKTPKAFDLCPNDRLPSRLDSTLAHKHTSSAESSPVSLDPALGSVCAVSKSLRLWKSSLIHSIYLNIPFKYTTFHNVMSSCKCLLYHFGTN